MANRISALFDRAAQWAARPGGTRKVADRRPERPATQHLIAEIEIDLAAARAMLGRTAATGDAFFHLAETAPVAHSPGSESLAAFAFLHMTTDFVRLPEGQPQRAVVTARDGRGPQHHDIDALVGNAVMPHADDFTCHVSCAQGAVPRAQAVLQVGNDAVSDAGVDVGSGCAHGLFLLGFAKQRRRLPARRRDRGVQAERGFAGNRLHGAEVLSRRRRKLGGSPLERAEGLAPTSVAKQRRAASAPKRAWTHSGAH